MEIHISSQNILQTIENKTLFWKKKIMWKCYLPEISERVENNFSEFYELKIIYHPTY